MRANSFYRSGTGKSQLSQGSKASSFAHLRLQIELCLFDRFLPPVEIEAVGPVTSASGSSPAF